MSEERFDDSTFLWMATSMLGVFVVPWTLVKLFRLIRSSTKKNKLCVLAEVSSRMVTNRVL